ncbi:hypothetical protein AB0C38_04485 [Amycolatopsis sp. NPDC048633]|uniref:hypothetical protein n=1 Tax=Amycolatopsis sp. NPDC048633 TaxID=3157095 RepID=UPI0033EFBCC5
MDTNISRRRIDAAALFADEFVGEAVHPDGLTEASIDSLLEDVDRELAADDSAAEAAYRFDFNDQRRVSRARRRAGREALRALPTRVQVTWSSSGEAA